MEHTESLTRYTANFVDELYQAGVRDVVISPGSRSTPLALTFAEHPGLKHWINMDERSAAFFALGMAKQQNRPVALVCTSGTAAANYYPAIVEAHYSRVPLVVLTADRPHELRDVGAPQAVDQIGMFQGFVKWFHEMALPDGSKEMLRYVRSKASRATAAAVQENQGPVHLNFPFREPLIPDFSLPDLWKNDGTSYYRYSLGRQLLAPAEANEIIGELKSLKKGVIVCGPITDESIAEEVVQLSKAWNLPVFADPLSQLRAGSHEKENILESYDAVLKSKDVRNMLQPDFVIRFGAMPVSKPYLLWTKENEDMKQFVIENKDGYREPSGAPVRFIYADASEFCRTMAKETHFNFSTDWLDTWKELNDIAKHHLLEEPLPDMLTEGGAVKQLAEAVMDQSTIYVGNSMPVRDLDTFFMNSPKEVSIMGNRGANGIDGITSSAIGAAAHGKRVTLLIGDLSFFHDFNGLMAARQYNIDLTVVLINNNGGGIFSFLPQSAEEKHFEVLFGTPTDIDFKQVVTMYGGNYRLADSWEEYRTALAESYQTSGLSVIEVQTDRKENVEWHRSKWEVIEEHITKLLKD